MSVKTIVAQPIDEVVQYVLRDLDALRDGTHAEQARISAVILEAAIARRFKAGLRIADTLAKLEQRLPVILDAIVNGHADLAGALARNQAHDAQYAAWVQMKVTRIGTEDCRG